MLLTWVLGGVAVGAVIYAIHTRRDLIESRKEYDNCCATLEIEKKKVNDLNTAIEVIRGRVLAVLDEGHKNLTISEESNAVSVLGTCPDETELVFLLKKIPFDPNDPEDREFAIRQAEELIETIQNF